MTMTTGQAVNFGIATYEMGSVDELFDALDFSGIFWQEAVFGDVGFRGQRNADWQLTPSAFRPLTAQFFYDRTLITGIHKYVENQVRHEIASVKAFVTAADEAGLTLPGFEVIQEIYGQSRGGTGAIVSDIWPSSHHLPAIAIAQHHGIHTRLLDFTINPKTALFFAAIDIVEKGSDSEKMAIWAVDLRFVNAAAWTATKRPEPVQVVRVSSASNQFLGAQQALFLTDLGVNDLWASSGPSNLDDVIMDRHKAHVHRHRARGRRGPLLRLPNLINPPVWKYVIDASAATDILRRLEKDGLTRLRLHPSLRDVVRSLHLEVRLNH